MVAVQPEEYVVFWRCWLMTTLMVIGHAVASE